MTDELSDYRQLDQALLALSDETSSSSLTVSCRSAGLAGLPGHDPAK
jgi:hypothetical protein